METDDTTPKNLGGRPDWKPTKQHRADAELYVATGMSEEDIARVFGIGTTTLRKYLHEELATGRAKRRAEIIRFLHKSAKGGNVSAQKHLESMTAMAASSRDEMARKAPPLGKKEEALQRAHNPDTSTPIGELMAQRAKLN